MKLAGNGVGSTNLVTPVSTTNGENVELSGSDGTTDSDSNFLSALNTETNVSVVITNDDGSLETGTLTSTGLLLDRRDLENLLLESTTDEVLDDFNFLDGKREKEDGLEVLDLVSLDETIWVRIRSSN